MELMEKLSKLDGNLHIDQNVYISSINMEELIKLIIDSKVVPSILITPYLIDSDEKGIYELYYCEFDVELHEEKGYVIKKQNKGNMLAKEINEKLSKGIIVNEMDYLVVAKQIQEYLAAMNTIDFSEEKESNESLENSSLYYQIFK